MDTTMKRCPDCDGIRRPTNAGGLWCSWCKTEERELSVRDFLQEEWDRRG